MIVNGCTSRDGQNSNEDVKNVEQQRLKWFKQYAGDITQPTIYIYTVTIDGEEIGPEGVEKFCFDLEVDPEDVSYTLYAGLMFRAVVVTDCHACGCLAYEG